MDRILGRHLGKEKGPLLVCIGAMHGNEPAGVIAIDLMLKMLEVEPITNPNFSFKGSFLGLVGNVQAFKAGKRFISRDMNRMFTHDNVERILRSSGTSLVNEEKEIRELLELIQSQIEEIKPEKLIVMDLHTTSSTGGIFTISTDDPESVDLAVELHAPVIKGLLKSIEGTSLHYFNEDNFKIPTQTVTFESGQHQEKLSVNRAIAAITNCMRTVGCVEAAHVENQHDILLQDYSRNLPKVVELLARHEISVEDDFRMKPDYKNFQKIEKGEVLATDKSGDVIAKYDGRILMPLYQDQGEEGFFIVKVIEGY